MNKKLDFFLIVILLISIAVFLAQLYFVSKVNYIRTADPARFANVAENLMSGKGFKLDTIGNYFVQFPKITHPEEYSFPLVSIILVPFIWLFGKTPLATKLPEMLAGTIFIPLIIYFLGKEIFDRKIGFLAAVSMLFLPLTFTVNFIDTRDPLFSLLVLISLLFFFKGMKNEKYFYPMGLFLGLTFLTRPNGIIIFGVVVLAYYLIQRKFSLTFFNGILLGIIIAMPWLIRNYLAFGDPLFTVNRYEAFIIGYAGYHEQIQYKVYWNIAKPSLAWLLSFRQYDAVVIKIMRELISQFFAFFYLIILTLIGFIFSSDKKISGKMFAWLGFIILFAFATYELNVYLITRSAYYGILIVVSYLTVLGTLGFFAKGGGKRMALFILFIAFALFSSIYISFSERFFLPVIPFMLMFSWFAIENIFQKIAEKYSRFEFLNKKTFVFILLVILILISVPYTFGKFFDKNAAIPYRADNLTLSIFQMAEKINNATPIDAVIMGCHVEPMRFYNGRKYVQLPAENSGTIIQIMKIYNISYLSFYGCERRNDIALIYYSFAREMPSPGFEYKLYKVNIEEIPTNTTKLTTINMYEV